MPNTVTVVCTNESDQARGLCGFPCVSAPNGWWNLTATELQSLNKTIDTAFVALTRAVPTGEQIDWLREVVPHSSGSPNHAVFAAADPVPQALRPHFTAKAGVVVRRAEALDIIVVSTDVLRNLTDAKENAATAVLAAITSDGEVAVTSGTGVPDLSLLPEPGPGQTQTSYRFLRRGLPSGILPAGVSAFQRGCVLSGLLLIQDDLDESHRQSQQFEGTGPDRTADYWHGLMHRREPDFGNASYWFRRVGRHAAFTGLSTILQALDVTGFSPALQQRIGELIAEPWDPDSMIAFCRAAIRDSESESNHAARLIQYTEMLNLLVHSLTRL